MKRINHWIAGLVFGLTAVVAAAHYNIPPAPQSEPVVIANAVIHTVSGGVVDGDMRLEGGRIVALGDRIDRSGARVVDLGGKHVYPGMIGANTVTGLVEVSAVRSTVDVAEVGANNANVNAEVAVNPDSQIIPVTRASGVLSVLTIPGGSFITGQSAVLQLEGWTWEEMTVKSGAALHIMWPAYRAVPSFFNPNPDPEEIAKQRDARLKELEEFFAQGRAWGDTEDAEHDLRLAAVQPVLRGEMPVIVHAEDIQQIRGAMQFADDHDVRIVILGGYDAPHVADQLAARDIPVIVAGTHRLPLRRWEPYDTPFTVAGKLHEAGVKVAIATTGGAFSTAHERNLPLQAATAAAYGLPRDEALKAVTLNAAEILGVGNRLGSLEVGKDATFFVSDGDPLEIRSKVERAWIAGREIDLSSHHTRLYEKYQQKYEQLENAAE